MKKFLLAITDDCGPERGRPCDPFEPLSGAPLVVRAGLREIILGSHPEKDAVRLFWVVQYEGPIAPFEHHTSGKFQSNGIPDEWLRVSSSRLHQVCLDVGRCCRARARRRSAC